MFPASFFVIKIHRIAFGGIRIQPRRKAPQPKAAKGAKRPRSQKRTKISHNAFG